MISNVTNLFVLLIVALAISTTTAGESKGLRNFENPESAITTTCQNNDDCASTTKCITENGANGCYCAKEAGECDGDGLCEITPRFTTRDLRRVCGCDGTTYANKSVAATNGVNVKHRNACVGSPRSDEDLALE